MVVTTVVFVAGIVLLTDGHLAIFSTSCRYSAEGVTRVSDFNVNLTPTILPWCKGGTFEVCSGQNTTKNIQSLFVLVCSENSIRKKIFCRESLSEGEKKKGKILQISQATNTFHLQC